jgi:hypothetical protein
MLLYLLWPVFPLYLGASLPTCSRSPHSSFNMYLCLNFKLNFILLYFTVEAHCLRAGRSTYLLKQSVQAKIFGYNPRFQNN